MSSYKLFEHPNCDGVFSPPGESRVTVPKVRKLIFLYSNPAPHLHTTDLRLCGSGLCVRVLGGTHVHTIVWSGLLVV